jgi:hypothetical protein
MKTIRDIKKRDEQVEAWMYAPEMGTLCRKGTMVYYAYIDGIYRESNTRFGMAEMLTNAANQNLKIGA